MKKRRLAALEFLFFSLLFLALIIPSLALPAGIEPIKRGTATGVQTITGVVSLVETTFRFFMTEGSGQYQSIYIDQTNWAPNIGDEVTVTGTVQTREGRIQLGNVTAYNVNSINNPVPAPAELSLAQLIGNESAYEAGLVKIVNGPFTVTNQNAGGGRWDVSDGVRALTISSDLDYNYFPRNGDQFDALAGVIKQTAVDRYRLQPRFTNDLWAPNNLIPNYALKGTVVTMDDDRNVLTDHYIWVRGDSIESITATEPAGAEKIVNVNGLIFPGLISTHDHPTWNAFDWIPFDRFFTERNDWHKTPMYHDFRRQVNTLGMGNEVIRLTEVRLASSGATVLQGATRNIDIGKLGAGIIHGERFPGRVTTQVVGATGSGMPATWADRHQQALRGRIHRYIPHLAETTDRGPTMARQWNDWKTYDSFDGRDTLIHGINIPPEDYALFDHGGTDVFGRPLKTVLSWAALSNMLLYNETADIPAALAAGAIVCLAPDWTPSGMPNMLAELNFARSVALDKGWNIQTRVFIDMVTRNAAKGFSQLWRYGTIEPGKMANLMVIDKGDGDPYDDLMMVAGGGADPDYRGGPQDVRLTIMAGRPIYGDPDLLNTANFPFLFAGRIEDLEICGRVKKLKLARWNPGNLDPLISRPFRDMYLEIWEQYWRGYTDPSDFLPVDPCGSVPPTPVPTPAPPPGTYIVNFPSDDAQQHTNYFDYTSDYVHIGRTTQPAGYNAGFRFNNIRIPRGENIDSALLILTQYTTFNTRTPRVQVAAHASDDSPTFTVAASGPLNRPLTSAKVGWTVPAADPNQELTSPDIRDVIQEIVNRPGWEEGNSITIIVAADEPSADNRRRIWAYSGDYTKAARLIIESEVSDTTPTPTPEGYKTPTPSPTPLVFWPTPVPEATPPYVSWYLPAGGAQIEGRDFDTYALIYNPNPFRVDYDVSFHNAAGEIVSFNRQTIPAMSRHTIRVNNFVENDESAVSTMVHSHSRARLMVERAMYWSPGGVRWGGGHGSVGIDDLSRQWFLAEGATHIFDKYIHVFNPSDHAADVTIELYNQAGDSWTESSIVPSKANWTFKANDLADDQTQLSALVTSDRPVAVERTMYWGKDDWRDGHSSRGISRLSAQWQFAEGATHLFDYYIVVMNPSPTAESETRFTFFLEGAEPIVHEVNIPPRRRHTVNVGSLVGSRSQVGARVESTNGVPLAAERTLYWNAAGKHWEGGHGTIGAAAPSLVWFLPEGATHRFNEYIMVTNPDASRAAQVRFRFHTPGGEVFATDRTVPPLGRGTVNVGDVVGSVSEVATHIYSLNAVGIVAERAMYWPDGTSSGWLSGHGSIGVPTLIVAPTPNAQP